MKTKFKKSASSARRLHGESGFSLIELVLVLAIMVVFATFAVIGLGHRKLYDSDDQALKIVDLVQTARQFALTQRQTMRVEFNLVQNSVRLIDENSAANSDDDVEIRKLTLKNPASVRIESRPTNITVAPPEVTPCPDASFSASHHPSSVGQNTFTIRFKRDGTVHDEGSNDIGANSVPRGATVYIYPPKDGSPLEAKSLGLVRAITVWSASGAIRLWGHNGDNTGGVNNTGWDDSRTKRTGT